MACASSALTAGAATPAVANGIVYMMDESSNLTAYAPPIVPVALDFNASGTTDLLLQDAKSGQSAMWLMNGTQLVQSLPVATIGADWQVQGANAD